MPRKTAKKTSKKGSESKVTVERNGKASEQNLFDRLQQDLTTNQSYLNLILGALIVIVLGVLLYNYFTKNQEVGPSQQTSQTQEDGDVAKDKLPGKYTVKEGDTLFSIAQSYYNDGYKYPSIVEANKLTNENILTPGQVLEIPKLPETATSPTGSPSESGSPTSSPSASVSPEGNQQTETSNLQTGEKGTESIETQAVWGENITGDTYTVQPGDWLSKIAGRAYGDVFAYEKIAQANNIQNPDSIEVGTVLKIPR